MDSDDSVHSFDSSCLVDSDSCNEEELEGLTSRPSTSTQRTKGSKEKVLPLGKCKECSRDFHSVGGFKTHMKMHNFQEMLLHGPPAAIVKSACEEKCKVVLEEMLTAPISHGKGPEVTKLVEALLASPCEDFFETTSALMVNCIPAPALLTPSKFHASFVKSVLDLQGSRDILVQSLEKVVSVEVSAIHCFLLAFLNRLSILVESFYLDAVYNPHVSAICQNSESSQVRDDLEDTDFKQTVHYVAGACVKSVLSHAIKSSKSAEWMRIVGAIKSKLIVNEVNNKPDEEISKWTESQNRASLKFVTAEVFDFFMALSHLLKEVEFEGSVLHCEVSKKVEESVIIPLLWDDLIGDFLENSESSLLRNELIKKFTNTWGHGTALRYCNNLVESTDNVALRAKVSR